METADVPGPQTQSPPEREWPKDFSDWLLGLAVVLSVALAVILPFYFPSLWTEHNLPSYVPFLAGAALSVMALGHGSWVGAVLWHRHFPRTQWRLVRQRLFTGSVALLTLWAVATDSWGWTVLFAVLLAVRLAAGRSDITWQRLAWLERHVAYQGSLGVRLNVRQALEHPATRNYFVQGHPNATDIDGAFEAWVESRCSELPPQPASNLREGWTSVRWVLDGYSVYKDSERQFIRGVFHEINLGPPRELLATAGSGVTLRLCILNGWLKLQVGRCDGDRIWTDICAFPLYAWIPDHKLPSVFMKFDAGIEASPVTFIRDERMSEQRRELVQRALDYERYVAENGPYRPYYSVSWFAEAAEDRWARERKEWFLASGAEYTSATETDFLDRGTCVLIPFLMEVDFQGGVNQRDQIFDSGLRVWREERY